MDLPESSRCWEWWRLPAARAPANVGIAIESSSIRSLEFQSLIAFSAAASSAGGTGAAPFGYADTAKDRREKGWKH
jgi:hypothetical protein